MFQILVVGRQVKLLGRAVILSVVWWCSRVRSTGRVHCLHPYQVALVPDTHILCARILPGRYLHTYQPSGPHGDSCVGTFSLENGQSCTYTHYARRHANRGVVYIKCLPRSLCVQHPICSPAPTFPLGQLLCTVLYSGDTQWRFRVKKKKKKKKKRKKGDQGWILSACSFRPIHPMGGPGPSATAPPAARQGLHPHSTRLQPCSPSYDFGLNRPTASPILRQRLPDLSFHRQKPRDKPPVGSSAANTTRRQYRQSSQTTIPARPTRPRGRCAIGRPSLCHPRTSSALAHRPPRFSRSCPIRPGRRAPRVTRAHRVARMQTPDRAAA